mgnify:CR=1 FL=1
MSDKTGSIKLNFPDLLDVDGAPEVELMKETCTLDVADWEGATLEAVADIMNLTRERVRQLEMSGLAKLEERLATWRDDAI